MNLTTEKEKDRRRIQEKDIIVSRDIERLLRGDVDHQHLQYDVNIRGIEKWTSVTAFRSH